MTQSLTKYTPISKAEAKALLLQDLKPGDTVYLVLRSRSRSGMMRHISPILFRGSDVWHLDAWVADLLDMGRGRVAGGDGVPVRGCGMDMGFHLVSTLAEALFGDSKALSHRWI